MRGFQIGSYERFCDLRHDGISVSAQSSHAGGNPMSQRECAGFNWPGFSVAAGEPVGVGPESVSCACPHSLGYFLPLTWLYLPVPSPALGVAHGASCTACSFSGRLFFAIVSGLARPSRQSRAVGVAQFACVLSPTPRLPSGFRIPNWSLHFGVAQLVRLAAPGRRSVPCDGPPFGPSCWQGVGQSAIFTCVRKRCWQVGRHSPSAQRSAHSSLPDLPASSRVGDSHEPQPLTDVRGADARSAQIRRPDGVIRTFHVRRNNVEPLDPIRACNLFSKDDWRVTLLDEAEPVRPEVPFVGDALSFSGCAKGLTGATSGPNGSIICPTGEPKRVRPPADAGEEVALLVAAQIGWCDFSDISLINMSRRDVSLSYEIA